MDTTNTNSSCLGLPSKIIMNLRTLKTIAPTATQADLDTIMQTGFVHIGDYMIDVNFNRFNTFSGVEEAKKNLLSCINCSWCVDCTHCTNCNECIECSACTECADCTYCTGFIDSTNWLCFF